MLQPAPIYGLDFAGDGAANRWFYYDNPLPQHPATYIFECYPRSKLTYYTLFVWGNRGSYYWNAGSPDSYYFGTPYPSLGDGNGGIKWEVSSNGGDNTTDVNSHDTTVQFNQWNSVAFTALADGSGKHYTNYWDLSRDTTKLIQTTEPTTYAATPPPSPSVMIGWHDFAVNPNEEFCGVIRGIQIYSAVKTLTQIQAKLNKTESQILALGDTDLWYLNLNPTPTDITDKSGNGHHFTWKDATARPTLWTG